MTLNATMDLVTRRIPLKEMTGLPSWVPEAVKKHGMNPEEAFLVRKGLIPSDVSFEEGEKASVDYITTKVPDRDREIVVPKGVDLSDYQRHPVVLYCHNYRPDDVPPGRCMWVKMDDKGLIAKTQYYTDDPNCIGAKIWGYRKAGFPMAKSIGFVPLDTVEQKDFPKMNIKELGLDDQDLSGVFRIYLRSLMLEYSDVPVPSNPQATEIAINKGLWGPDFHRKAEEDRAIVLIDLNGAEKMVRNESDPSQERSGEVPEEKALEEAVVEPEPPEIVPEEKAGSEIEFCICEKPDEGEGDVCKGCGKPMKKPVKKASEGKYYCECPECGEKMMSTTVCSATKCEKCGKTMMDATEGKRSPDGKGLTRFKSYNPGQDTGWKPPEEKGSLIRWNPNLSKEFDVSKEELPAASPFYELIKRFLGCEMKDVSHTSSGFSGVEMGNYLSAFKFVTREWDVKDIRNILADGSEAPPIRDTIQLNSKAFDEFLIKGAVFSHVKDGDKFTPIIIKFDPGWGGIDVDVYVKYEDREVESRMWTDVWKWIDENNWLKGEKFSLSGQFIEKTSVTWDDVFLSEKNGKAVMMVSKALETKGKDMPPRGAIFLGQPGTGKTLSGKVLCNTLDDVTFVWMSARDFYYSGAMGGLMRGFDIARKLSPSVMFIEDVDDHLNGRSIDLLKTELDGLRQQKGVATILTSNYPELLPNALIDRPGRFHDILEFGLPDAQTRAAMLRRWSGTDLVEKDLQSVVVKTAGYSGAHMFELVSFAKSLMEDDETLSMVDALEASLSKIKEQRELITRLRNEGGGYDQRMKGLEIDGETVTFDFAPEAGETVIIDKNAEVVLDPEIMGAIDKAAVMEKEGRVLSGNTKRVIRTALDALIKAVDESEEASSRFLDKAMEAQEILEELLISHELNPDGQQGQVGSNTEESPAVDVGKDVTVTPETLQGLAEVLAKSVGKAVGEATKEQLEGIRKEIPVIVQDQVDAARGRMYSRNR